MKLSTLIYLFLMANTALAANDASPLPAHTDPAPATGAAISGRVMIQGKIPMDTGIILLFNRDSGTTTFSG